MLKENATTELARLFPANPSPLPEAHPAPLTPQTPARPITWAHMTEADRLAISHLTPPTLPDEEPNRYWISKYKNTRFWAVYDAGVLVTVAVYKKGALEVLRHFYL